jgi:zinc protease
MPRVPLVVRAAAAIIALAPAGALAAPGIPESRALPNGLKVVLLEDHALPLVAASLWVHAGSKDEIDSSAGYAHFLEHLVQRGTDAASPFEYQRLAQRWGGSLSVRSNYDRTYITLTGTSGVLEAIIEALGAMAFRARLLDKEIDLELGTLSQEIRTYYDQPASVAFLETVRATFPEHPYRYPMLGNFRTLGTLKHDPITAFYRNLYVPNNMAIAVAGDFDPARAAALVEAAFGKAPKSATLPPKPDPPAGFPGHKDVEKRLPLKETWVNLAFLAPGYRHPDRAAFEIIARALGEPGGSPLSAALARDKVGSGAQVSYYHLEDAGMLYVGLTPATPELAYTAARSAMREIAEFKRRGLDEPVLRAHVERLLLEDRLRAERISERAEGLGEAALFGGTRYYWDRPLVHARLTTDDVRRVAAAYLVPDNLRLVVIVPRDAGPIAEEQKEAFHQAMDRLGKAPEGSAPALAGSIYAPQESGRVTPDAWGNWRDARALQDPERLVLPNGLIVVAQEDHRLPLAAAALVLRAGSGHDPAGKEGLANLAGRLIASGAVTPGRPEDGPRAALGVARPDVQVSRDFTELRLLVPPARLEPALRGLAAALRRPEFSGPATAAGRTAAREALERGARDASFVAGSLFAEKVYAGHPYAHPPAGTTAGLASITSEDLTAFHRARIGPSGAVIAITGDLAAAEMLRLARGLLGDWRPEGAGDPGGGTQAEAEEGPSPRPRGGEFARTVEADQSQVIVGVPGVPLGHDDFEDLRLLGTALTMLAFEDMVFERRAAFSATALPEAWRAAGSLAIQVATAHLRRDEAVFDLQRLMRRLSLEELAPKEIEDLVRIQAGREAASAQGVLARASLLGYREAAGLGAASYRRAMTPSAGPPPARLKEVAARYLRPEAWIVVKAGPPSR